MNKGDFEYGSWLSETFEYPNHEYLNIHLATVMDLMKKENDIAFSMYHGDPGLEPFSEKDFQWAETVIQCNNIEYKQYHLICFLHYNTSFQEYVHKRCKKHDLDTIGEENYTIFKDFLDKNIQVFISGLQLNGSQYMLLKDMHISKRRIYGFMQIIRSAAIALSA